MGIAKNALATLLVASVVIFTSCSSSVTKQSNTGEPQVLSNTSTRSGGAVITDEMIGRSRGSMHLSNGAADPSYAYSDKSPVQIGGGFGSGSDRTYQFLNALRGPKGEMVTYSRVGTCCPFKSPSSPFDGEALLEVYEIRVVGSDVSRRLYFNWYDEAEALVPVGLTAVQ